MHSTLAAAVIGGTLDGLAAAAADASHRHTGFLLGQAEALGCRLGPRAYLPADLVTRQVLQEVAAQQRLAAAGPAAAPYDLIVNDAYQGGVGQGRDVPFLRDVAAALRPGSGIYCVNVLSTGADEGAHLRAEAAMEEVFGSETRIAVDGSNAWLCATAPAAEDAQAA